MKELQRRLDEVEAAALQGGKKQIQALEQRLSEAEKEIEKEQQRHSETQKIIRKQERRFVFGMFCERQMYNNAQQ